MDYSQLSDFEINKRVADIVMNGTWHVRPSHPDNTTGGWLYDSNGIQTYDLPDYCNSPESAWPIITKNRISIEFDGDNSTEPQTTWCHTANLNRTCGTNYQKNPLRAAMITFLLMQEQANA
ncbi:TPA: DUF2591 family protein [Citrobacter sedlakii]|uniref:phage protein NinX family protein n=1 Tax=Citrobacter sedlakii TaxID=67826 RepID=UPI00388FBBC1|nr:DUF2591 family protein [Citrobacter sedlakii]